MLTRLCCVGHDANYVAEVLQEAHGLLRAENTSNEARAVSQLLFLHGNKCSSHPQKSHVVRAWSGMVMRDLLLNVVDTVRGVFGFSPVRYHCIDCSQSILAYILLFCDCFVFGWAYVRMSSDYS